MAYAFKHEKQAVTASGLDVLAGIWLLICPFVLSFQHVNAATANDVMFGLLIGLLAVYRFCNPAYNPGVSRLNAVLGLWILLCPVLFRFADNRTAILNNIISGIIVFFLATWSAWATGRAPRSALEPNRPH